MAHEIDIRICLVAIRNSFAGSGEAANLIQNGSFETASDGFLLPALTGSGLALANGSTAMADWTVTGGDGDGDGLAWLGKNDQYGPTTPFGDYFLDLTGYGDRTPYFGVEQTIATVVGQSYALTFNLGVDQSNGLYSGPIGVTATAGSTSMVFDTFNPPGTGEYLAKLHSGLHGQLRVDLDFHSG